MTMARFHFMRGSIRTIPEISTEGSISYNFRMRILVIGASGQVGRRLMKILQARGHEVTGTYYTNSIRGLVHLATENEIEARNVLKKARPEVVFVPGGVTAVDWCEQNPELARQRNDLSHIVTDARLVYFSTDYVFDGRAGPYNENSQPAPINYYGQTKLAAERQALSVKDSLVIRTANVYSFDAGGKNFFMQVYNGLKGGKQMSAFSDQKFTPTYAHDLAEFACNCLESKYSGIVHAAGPDFITRVEFMHSVAEFFGFDRGNIVEKAMAEVNLPAKRPARGGLVSIRREFDAFRRFQSVRESLESIKRELQ